MDEPCEAARAWCDAAPRVRNRVAEYFALDLGAPLGALGPVRMRGGSDVQDPRPLLSVRRGLTLHFTGELSRKRALQLTMSERQRWALVRIDSAHGGSEPECDAMLARWQRLRALGLEPLFEARPGGSVVMWFRFAQAESSASLAEWLDIACRTADAAPLDAPSWRVVAPQAQLGSRRRVPFPGRWDGLHARSRTWTRFDAGPRFALLRDGLRRWPEGRAAIAMLLQWPVSRVVRSAHDASERAA